MLKQTGYSLQSNRKTKEGGSHPDRNAQFEHINAVVERFQQRGQPVISVDTKKKELVGPFKNGGREWQPKGEPEEVVIHDFVDEELGKVIPYGVFDLSLNEGWVSVGIDHDTAQFAVQRHRPVVAEDGGQALSAGPRTADHRRWRWQQRQPLSACGRWRCRSWRRAWAFPFMCAISRQAPASGTRSSIGCSATSPRTGAVARW